MLKNNDKVLGCRPAIVWIVAGILIAALPRTALGEDPSEWTDQQKERFLREAEITHIETLELGVTRSQRATLSLGGVSHDAQVQTVDIAKKRHKLGAKTEFNFRDSYRYNIAAYQLDRILALNMVPVSVDRIVRGKKAAVTWWVDDVLMMETDRVAQGVQPPVPSRWNRQNHRMMIFSELIYNTDFNRGNLLITRDWKVWLIDFTRAFRVHKSLFDQERLKAIDSRLLERLRGLRKQDLESGLKSCLTKPERMALLARRDKIVQYFESKAKQASGAEVIYDIAEDAL